MSTSTANTGGLVTEARPIAWKHLSKDEKDLIELRADPWIKAAIKDSGRSKPGAHKIDGHRTGRVLFIDGVRGAGKTSFLLTLLKHWKSGVPASKYKSAKCHDQLEVFLPVLDFDPLPRGMPLHGWLLEPWRRLARVLDNPNGASATGAVGGVDLTESFAELFERAVLGWADAHYEGKSVIDNALKDQERSSGWLETYANWKSFVGAMVCKRVKCRNDKCAHAHEFVFVLAIDDVDLQVEHLPALLHAIRLFHHPNVAYVLTGNYEHLRFALLLDYIRRHDHLLAGRHTRRGDQGGDQGIDLWNDINKHSERLCDAFLEKALPRQARLPLGHLSLAQALNVVHAGNDKTVKQMLDANDAAVKTLMELPPDGQGLSLVTARRAQQAADELLEHIRKHDDWENSKTKTNSLLDDNLTDLPDALKYVSSLCGTGVTKRAMATPKWQFTLRGQITTRLGTVLRSVAGRNRTTLLLAERPRFVFLERETDVEDEVRAHQALVVQLLVDSEHASAPALVWGPEAGILATEVKWDSPLREGRALFHWPILVRPTAREVIETQHLAEKLNLLIKGNTQAALDVGVLCVWLSQNLTWCYNHSEFESRLLGADITNWNAGKERWIARSEEAGLDDVAAGMKDLSGYGDELKGEVESWVREILVMTAPCFGLPDKEVGQVLRAALMSHFLDIASNKKALREEQLRVVKDAIMAADVARDMGRTDKLESSDVYKAAAEDLIAKRRKGESTHSWWKWIGVSDRSRGKGGSAKKNT